MKLTQEMYAEVAKRLQDPDYKNFSKAIILQELNLAQIEICTLLNPENLIDITEKNEEIYFDFDGLYALGGLSKDMLVGEKFIVKLLLYRVNSISFERKIYPFRSLDEEEVNKVFVNSFFKGTEKFPLYMVTGSDIEAFAELHIITATPSTPFSTVTAEASEKQALSGPLDITAHYYAGGWLYNHLTGNYYKISDYNLSSTDSVFNLSTTLSTDDQANTDWILYPKNKKHYCGMGKISYIREPITMVDVASPTTGSTCDFNDQITNIIMLLTESTIWRSDGKYDRAKVIYDRAVNLINAMNGTIPVTDNVGPRASRE